jgi:hypothetical protein
MLEDPWAELEQKLKNSLEKCGPNLSSVVTFVSDSDEGANTQETSDEGANTQETDSSVSVSEGSL